MYSWKKTTSEIEKPYNKYFTIQAVFVSTE